MSMALNMAEMARQRLEPEVPMEELLGQYLRGGLVHVEPGLVLLAHECHFAPETGEVSHSHEPNAWFVRLAARVAAVQLEGLKVGRWEGGMLSDFLRIVPYPHEWALWCRRADGRVRAHRMSALRKFSVGSGEN